MQNKPLSLNAIKNNDRPILIVGLGNPGKKYQLTRHNAGFWVIDSLLEILSKDNTVKEIKTKNESQSYFIPEQNLYLVKPLVYMNNSGYVISEIINFYKIAPEVIVAYDDLDFELGKYKIQYDKLPKDHNGVNSVKTAIAPDKFWSIRVGIDNRPAQYRRAIPSDMFVLKKLEPDEVSTLRSAIEKITKQLTA